MATHPFNSQYILAKNASADKLEAIDVSGLLRGNEVVDTVVLTALFPTTSPTLVFNAQPQGTNQIQLEVRNGLENVTYGARLRITSDIGNIYDIVVAVYVADNLALNNQYIDRNPSAFQTLLGEIQAGDAASARINFPFQAGRSFTNASVMWSLIDDQGVVYAQGNAYNYIVRNTSLSSSLEAFAVVHAPSDLAPSIQGFSYQIRWELEQPGSDVVYSFQTLTVLGGTTSPQGVQDLVEMHGDPADASIVLGRIYDAVGLEVFQDNNLLQPFTPATLVGPVDGGMLFQKRLDTTSLVPSLDPYSVIWKYADVEGQTLREHAKMFVVTPTILGAVTDCKAFISRARTTLMGLPDMMFEDSLILTFLRRGRDMFNGAGGYPTTFTMTGAAGPIREFWMRYAEVALLRSQYLAEGEKAFDFQGQAISLNVDRTQVYQGLADSIQSQLDNDVKPFKAGLLKKGISGGDGNFTKTPFPAVGYVGLGMNPMTQIPWGQNLLRRIP